MKVSEKNKETAMSVRVGSLYKFKQCIILVFVSVLSLSTTTEAGNAGFVKLNLDSSYQVEIPKTWKIHNKDTTTAFHSKAVNSLSAANVKQKYGKFRIFLAANAYSGISTVATARLSAGQTKTLSQSDLKQMTQDEFNDMTKDSEDELHKTDKASGIDVRSTLISINRKVINGNICISTESDMNYGGRIIMRNIIDLYFLGDREVQMIVSYNLAEAKKFKPIVEKIRNSLTIK